MPDRKLRKTVFLDRDCTFIEDMQFSVKREDMRPLPGALDALRRLHKAGYQLIVITNQSGIARGLFTEAEFNRFNEFMFDWFEKQGVRFADLYYCPHHADGVIRKYRLDCDCRKPKPALILRAAREHAIDLKQSWMIGDRPADIGAGKAAGCRTIRVLTGPPVAHGDPEPDFLAADIQAAVEHILAGNLK